MWLRAGFTLLTVIGLQACASNPLSPKGMAIYDALDHSATLNAWADACNEVSPRARGAVEVARRTWWERNRPLMEGADFGLAWDMVNVVEERVDTSGRLVMGMTWQVAENGRMRVDEALAGSKDQEAVCLKNLESYKNGDRDLATSGDTYQQLLELQNQKARMGRELDLKKTAMLRRDSTVYGRSFYVVEKMAKQSDCPGAQVRLLNNAWPNEVYDAQCDNGEFLIYRCEWGNCATVR